MSAAEYSPNGGAITRWLARVVIRVMKEVTRYRDAELLEEILAVIPLYRESGEAPDEPSSQPPPESASTRSPQTHLGPDHSDDESHTEPSKKSLDDQDEVQ